MDSYAHGTCPTALLGESVADCLDRIADGHPDAEALVSRHQQIRVSYAAFRVEATRIAQGLLAIGVEAGDRVALWSFPCAEWLIAQYAVAKIGGVLVGLNPAYRAQDLEYALARLGVTVLLVGCRVGANDLMAIVKELVPDRVPSLRTIVSLGADVERGALPWNDLARRSADVTEEQVHARQAAIGFDEPAMILYTSGTTGRPKGVVLSHHNVTNGGFFVGEHLRYTTRDRICQPLPTYHVLGCVAANVAGLTHGAALVLPSPTFDARRCLETIEQEQCTAIYGVPTTFIAMLEHPGFASGRFDSLRTGVVSGAPCPAEVMRRIIDDMHVREITVAYGMTEMAPILFTATGDSLDNHRSTAGTVQPHVECKIVDPASGRVVPRGVAGELCARGYCAMRGYWDDREATEAAIDRNGWMHSGDLAVMRHDGYVSIVGRIKDIVIRGGENVSPFEIEERLRRHASVSDACIVGVPDRIYGEEICAWIRLRHGETATVDELRQYCCRYLAPHKVPRYVYFTTDFPTTPSGKVTKSRLRELAAERLAGAQA